MGAHSSVSSRRYCAFRFFVLFAFFALVVGTACFVLLLVRPTPERKINPDTKFAGMVTSRLHFSGADLDVYKLHISAANWTEAVHICSHEDAHLAIINSKTESDILRALMEWFLSSGNFTYLGFHDREEEGKYRTIFGLPLSYTGFEEWATGYPIGTDQFNCGCMDRSGGLCDCICNASIPFFCEKFRSAE